MRSSPARVAQAALCFALTTAAACGSSDPAAPSPPPALDVTDVLLHSDIAVVEGVADSAAITLDNPGTALARVHAQAWIVQGATRRSGADTALACGGAPGALPAGPCTMSFPFTVSAAAAGSGTLVTGPATVEVRLVDSAGAQVGLKTAPVTLVPDSVAIFDVTLLSDTLTIDGGVSDGTAKVFNPGTSRTNTGIQSFVLQGAAHRAGGGFTLSCGSGAGILPAGSCTFTPTFAASSTGAGTGTFVPGPATLEVDLAFNGNPAFIRDIPVVLK